uniref:Uncharacterized protein n=1 Tax=Arundo donax TaxID=35708 RepID=A0A0A9BB93_ARUDO
MRQGRGCAD